jgi:hypothetical protein
MREQYEVFDEEMEEQSRKNLNVISRTVAELQSGDITKKKNKRLKELRSLYRNISIQILVKKRINDLIIKKIKRGIRNVIKKRR